MKHSRMTDGLFTGEPGLVLDGLAPVSYAPGAVIFRQGAPAGHAYIIERGQVQIARRADDTDSVVAVLGPGELLGEMSSVDNQNRSATATALAETEVIPISRGQLQQALEAADPIVQLLLRVLIDRLRPARRERGRENGDEHEGAGGSAAHAIDAIRGRAIDRIKLESALREALNQHEFRLYFQPIVRLRDCGLAGFEALIRWATPDQGLVSPQHFMRVAEESELIIPIGLWVLHEACCTLDRFQQAWRRAHPGEPPLFVSANVSARQLRHAGAVEDMVRTINRTGVDPAWVKIEITEGLMLENPEVAIAAFERFKAIGATIALDDFGTGYSSLSYLHRFPISTLKIDRSFVNSMLHNSGSLAIVRTITRLAGELSLDVVSEGIERPEELARLREFGSDYGQGYLFSKPIPAADALELVAARRLWESMPGATARAAVMR